MLGLVLALVLVLLTSCGERPAQPPVAAASGDEAATGRSGSHSDRQASPAPSSPEVAVEPQGAPRTATHRVGRSADGTYEVEWSPVGGVIPDADPFAIAVAVRRVDGRALAADATVRVDAEMPHHGHGMNLVPVVTRQGGAGAFVAEGMLFHMTGRWVLAVDVEEDGVAERTQWFVDIE